MDDRAPDRVQQRAEHLLPEEQAAGSDDPRKQAAAVLADSDAREAYAEPTPDLRIHHRRSEETVDPRTGLPDSVAPDGTDPNGTKS